MVTARSGPPAAPVLDLVARIVDNATEVPDAVAVADEAVQLTYRELLERALTLSARLREAGCGRDDPVALCLPRSADLVVGALGILAAGAGYVALDPDLPRPRLHRMVADSGARVLVRREGDAAAPPTGIRVLGVPTDSEVTVPPASPAAEDLAYVVYTSGSTGTPKGVMVEHAALANLVRWHLAAFRLGATDRVAQIASPGFDASVWEIWPCLAAGATLEVVPEALKTDPGGLRDWLVAQRITVSFLPTPLAESVIQLTWPAAAPLRVLLTGGDALRRRPPEGLPFRLVNNYGVSEAAVVTTSGDVAAREAGPEDTVAPDIGSAIDGVELRVVDSTGAPTSDGVAGELVVAGVSVARGYVGRADLTGQRFGTDRDGTRTYRTGDLVRRRPDGRLDHLGRMDDQVQIRGFRVEPGEIEAVLNQHPAVTASAVLAAGEQSDRRLVGFVVPRAGARYDAAAVSGWLLDQLPSYLVPAELVAVAELPLTSQGKVDRPALLAQLPGPVPDVHLAEPATELEGIIARIVAERLGVPTVGTQENFFLLGGHSMLGAQLVTRINERFGIEMTLRALFEGPTVAELAAEVERQLLAEIDAMSDEQVLRAATQYDDG